MLQQSLFPNEESPTSSATIKAKRSHVESGVGDARSRPDEVRQDEVTPTAMLALPVQYFECNAAAIAAEAAKTRALGLQDLCTEC